MTTPVLEPRWRVGTKLGRTLYRDGRCIGMVDTPELAAEIVAALNGAAPNDRESIAKSLEREANRIWNTQAQDYPSNVLDTVAWNIRMGAMDLLTERSHPNGLGPEPARRPSPADQRTARGVRDAFCPPSEMEADELMYAAAEWMDDSEAMYREGKPVSTWPELTAALRAYAAVIEADRASRPAAPVPGEGAKCAAPTEVELPSSTTGTVTTVHGDWVNAKPATPNPKGTP